jgi:hypothetical protein
MNTHSSPTLPHSAHVPDAAARRRLSDAARDAGDRVCCTLLVASVLIAIALGAIWIWEMPPVR